MSRRLVFLVLAFFLLTCGAMAATASYAVNVAVNETLGEYLVNETGFALYYFQNDAPGNGISTCYGECANIWPSFYVDDVTVSSALNATDFSVIDRTDGSKQIAYKGWPLYFYYLDTKAGDTLGQGVKGIWFVINPANFPAVQT